MKLLEVLRSHQESALANQKASVTQVVVLALALESVPVPVRPLAQFLPPTPLLPLLSLLPVQPAARISESR